MADTHTSTPTVRDSSLGIFSRTFANLKEWRMNKPRRSPKPKLTTFPPPPSPHPPRRFTCERCAATNTFVPLCLWCSWAAGSTLRDSASRERSTTVITGHDLMQRNTSRPFSAPPAALYSATKGAHGDGFQRSQQQTLSDSSTTRLRHGPTEECVGMVLEVADNPSIIPIATGSHTASASRKDRRRPLPILIDPRPTAGIRHSPSRLDMSPSTKHTRSFSSPIVLDLSGHYDPLAGEAKSSSSSSSSARGQLRLGPTLRRKKRMSYIRASPPTHLYVDNLSMESDLDPVVEEGGHHFTTKRRGEPIVRLGHPSRPYYNAIRKNMSRSVSPSSDESSWSSSPSPMSSGFLQSMPTGLLDSDTEDLPSPFGTPLHSEFPYPRCGFSLSGEMEMRMALAAQRTRNRPGDRPEYIFVDTMKRRSGGVRGLKKRLGEGIKQLVLRRSQ